MSVELPAVLLLKRICIEAFDGMELQGKPACPALTMAWATLWTQTLRLHRPTRWCLLRATTCCWVSHACTSAACTLPRSGSPAAGLMALQACVQGVQAQPCWAYAPPLCRQVQAAAI